MCFLYPTYLLSRILIVAAKDYVMFVDDITTWVDRINSSSLQLAFSKGLIQHMIFLAKKDVSGENKIQYLLPIP